MRVAEKAVQRRVALALAHLCSPEDQRTIFIDNNGMSFSSLTFDIIQSLVHTDFKLLTSWFISLVCRVRVTSRPSWFYEPKAATRWF